MIDKVGDVAKVFRIDRVGHCVVVVLFVHVVIQLKEVGRCQFAVQLAPTIHLRFTDHLSNVFTDECALWNVRDCANTPATFLSAIDTQWSLSTVLYDSCWTFWSTFTSMRFYNNSSYTCSYFELHSIIVSGVSRLRRPFFVRSFSRPFLSYIIVRSLTHVLCEQQSTVMRCLRVSDYNFTTITHLH